jgi:hypothetical protein
VSSTAPTRLARFLPGLLKLLRVLSYIAVVLASVIIGGLMVSQLNSWDASRYTQLEPTTVPCLVEKRIAFRYDASLKKVLVRPNENIEICKK